MKKLLTILGILAVSLSFIACTNPGDRGDNTNLPIIGGDDDPPIIDNGDEEDPPENPTSDVYVPAMKENGHLYVHYYRADGEYSDYALWIWGSQFEGRWITGATEDSSGAVFDIRLSALGVTPEDALKVNFIVSTVTHEGNTIKWGVKDGGDNDLTLGNTQKLNGSYHWYVKQGMTSDGGRVFETVMGISHTHTYEPRWYANETYHYHKANCGHDIVIDKEYHNMVNGKCSVCNYKPEAPEPTEPDPVYVSFSAGVGAFPSGQDKITIAPDANGKISAVESAPRADGYAFIGWYNGATKFDPTQRFTSSQTFTAKYTSGADNIVYDALFDESSTVSVQINMSDAEWKKLNADYKANKKSPIYRLADSVTIGIDDGDGMLYYYYEEVGVRMKGNTSRHEFYNADDGFYKAIHMKLSFKQTFDDVADGYKQDELKTWTNAADRKVRKNRTFGGMEKIDIKYNSTLDETYIRELYAMKTFRANGIYAPHITLGTVTALNKDESMINLGVYRIHEPVDDVFVNRNISDTGVGDLWKCTWGNSNHGADMVTNDLENIVGINDELNFKVYAYDKKTNKKAGLDSIKNFIRGINGNNVDFENYIDTDYFAKFEAVNYLLGNPDCIRNNANNYYVYFRKSDGKAILIPYDYDRCLGLTYGLDSRNGMINATPYSNKGLNDSNIRNPLYTKLIVKGSPSGTGSVLIRYRQNILNIADSNMFKIETFSALENAYKARYGSYTNGAIGNSIPFDGNWGNNKSVNTYITGKRHTINNNIDDYSY